MPNERLAHIEQVNPNYNAHDKEFYIQWHLTNKCNLRCEHCYQEDYSQSSELSLDEIKTVAEKINYTLTKWGK